MAWLFILGFALSSSLDNLGVGISYGIRGIRIGLVSNLIMAAICFILSEAGIVGGQWISRILPGIFPTLVGAFVLIIIGIRIVLLALPRKKQLSESPAEPLSNGDSLKELLKNPEKADLDRSGEIGYLEAVVLGLALSANAVTNGLGAGLLGLSPLAIAVTAAIGSFITVWAGTAIGRKASTVRIGSFHLGQMGTLISGVVLLVIACNALFG